MIDASLTHNLIENTTLLLSLATAQWLIFQRLHLAAPYQQFLSGLLFGLIASAMMVFPLALEEGVIFDARTVALAIGSLFGGPVVGLVAGGIAAGARVAIGGAGMPVGLASILLAVLAGLAYRQFRHRGEGHAYRLWDFLLLGLAVHLGTSLLFTLLPAGPGADPFREIAPLFLPVMTLATVLLGFLMREIERSRHFSRIQAASAARFEDLFQSASISIWEEDLTGVLAKLARLREEGIADLRAYLMEDPRRLEAIEQEVRVRHVNRASLSLFKAKRESELTGSLRRVWGPGAESVFLDAVCAIWAGDRHFTAEAGLVALDGTPLQVVISYPIPKNSAEARAVPVSIADISGLRLAEQEVEAQRTRLQEIIWATNVATWEWNVRTGATRFDEKWAEMIGYGLEEISPVSIETWQEFCHPDDLARSDAILQKVFSRALPHYECELRMRHRDGHWVWVLDRGKVVEWDEDGQPLRMSGTHADISERKASEIRLARIAAIREAILQCESALFRQMDEESILQQTCDLLVQAQDYALVWIGIPEQDDRHTVRPVARAGRHGDYVDKLTVHWAEDAYSQGPTGMAVKTGTAQVLHDLQRAQASTPWAGMGKAHDFHASAALPMVGQDGVLAVLNVYSQSDTSFEAEEVELLTDFAGTLALVLENVRGTAEKRRMGEALARSAFTAVGAIAKTIEKRDPYTSGHQQRVAELAAAIAGKLGWDRNRIDGLRLAASIHDIGKIYVPAEILNRPGRLTESEFAIIKAHPAVGAEILECAEFPWPIKDMIEQHHERPDGSGYPHGLKGDAILPEAKIIAVADVVEAITSHRPYRPALGLEEGLAEIAAGRGSRYDPAIVDACMDLFRNAGFGWKPAPDTAVDQALPTDPQDWRGSSSQQSRSSTTASG